MSTVAWSCRIGRIGAVGSLVSALLASAAAFAALPPEYQRQRELAAIAASPEIAASLAPHPIKRIEAVGHDLYRVEAGPCGLRVRIVGDPQDMPGPRSFHLAIGSRICR